MREAKAYGQHPVIERERFLTRDYPYDTMGKTMKGRYFKMPDAPSKRRWDAENTVLIAVKFQKKTDQDVIDFLEGKNKRNVILEAIREYMEHHKEE